MILFSRIILRTAAFACLISTGFTGCKATGNDANGAATQPLPNSPAASAPPQAADEAPPPEKTGGFDGKRGFAHVAKQVSFGPRPSGSQAIVHLQDYLQTELKSYGCNVETDSFGADTPVGRLPMKNILVKIPGEKPGVILLGTHYDTLLMDNFVGADDAGSSTAVMLELARLLCPQEGKYAVWIAFFDGEEAMKHWSDTDSRYGSRQMAARFSSGGDIKKIKAFLLADIVGGREAQFLRESSSTPALIDLVWNTAAKLGYSGLFLNNATAAQDDHDSFLKRGVPSVDVIGDFVNNGYWHTPQDSLDKISAKTLAITGHVFLETVKQLQAK
ncbi:MAG TPA: M28 family peptidase [Candidatus Acidoferrales bacterium]|nr:M28 family peptidase [Candidatus Acidoferrales bacterium]